jgi:hypothetical protein
MQKHLKMLQIAAGKKLTEYGFAHIAKQITIFCLIIKNKNTATMENKIEDYLHLYIGCKLKGPTGTVTLMSVIAELPCTNWGIAVLNGNQSYTTVLGDYKPVLRPLSTITGDEAKECYKLNPYSKGEWLIEKVIVRENIKGYMPNIVDVHWKGKEGTTDYACGVDVMFFNKLNPEQHRYLLSKHFDLFGLIEAGLAIAKPTKK